MSAAFSLPGQQNIRQDLERLEERNRLIGRMGGILADIPEEVKTHSCMVVKQLALLKTDATAAGESTAGIDRLLAMADRTNAGAAAVAFMGSDVADMVQLYGLGYAGYHRLKVASVTDDLTTLVTQLIGARPDSNDWSAARYFVRAWRDMHYSPYRWDRQTAAEVERARKLRDAIGTPVAAALGARLARRDTENAFLLEYDLRFGLRRLDYVLNKIDDLICMDDRARITLRAFGVDDSDPWINTQRRAELTRMSSGLGAVYALLQWRIETLGDPRGKALDVKTWHTSLAGASGLDAGQQPEALESSITPQLGIGANGLGVNAAARLQLLGLDEGLRDAAAVKAVAAGFEKFEALADELKALVRETSTLASSWSQANMPAARSVTGSDVTGGDIARFFYDHFESVDRISFPVFYQTDVGQETDIVSVVRISPDDCASITEAGPDGQVHKLGGERFGHFGGFFAKEWRASDYLWGQLDGAERLVRSVCANALSKKATKDLVEEAQLAILSDDANVCGIEKLQGLTAEQRLQELKEKWQELSAPPKQLSTTLATSVASAIGILGKIVRADSQTLVGKVARRLGPPLLWLARSVVDENAAYVFVLVATALGVIAAWALTTAGSDARAGVGGPGLLSLAMLWLLVRIVGGVSLVAIVGVAQLLRSKISAALGNVLKL